MLDIVLHKQGGELKSAGTRKSIGQGIRFGDETTKDTYKEFFHDGTEVGLVNGHTRPFMLEHGKSADFGKAVLGFATYEKKADGWEYQLEMLDNEKGNKAAELIEGGGYKTSTGSAIHTITRVKVGDAYRLDSWFITETSGTKTPADIYNRDLTALKSAFEYADLGLLDAVKSDNDLLRFFAEQIKSLNDILQLGFKVESEDNPKPGEETVIKTVEVVLPKELADEIAAIKTVEVR